MVTATDLANHQSANSAYGRHAQGQVGKPASSGSANVCPACCTCTWPMPASQRGISARRCPAHRLDHRAPWLKWLSTTSGPPPVSRLMVGGRHGGTRVHSDQDNALFRRRPAGARRVFSALARFVSDGLAECGSSIARRRDDQSAVAQAACVDGLLTAGYRAGTQVGDVVEHLSTQRPVKGRIERSRCRSRTS